MPFEHVVQVTDMSPAFYLDSTKMIVSPKLGLLKRINDLDFVVSIKGSPCSSTDF